MKILQVKTSSRSVAIDITHEVQRAITEAGFSRGLSFVYVPHTTAGVTINEGADPHVMEDVMNTLDRLVPWQGSYRHTEGNAAAHIKTSLMGNGVHLFVEGGKLVLGTWQRIFLCEFDGPRTRKVHIHWINAL
ncbi:MAG: secondary thiamine-phosphate synthase enzyme YjbQ [Syntrophobacterales bacterium]|nr:secondary thiamine-phosphate synthase enzyme YjbQ [Syntrophobacterales bacterium]